MPVTFVEVAKFLMQHDLLLTGLELRQELLEGYYRDGQNEAIALLTQYLQITVGSTASIQPGPEEEEHRLWKQREKEVRHKAHKMTGEIAKNRRAKEATRELNEWMDSIEDHRSPPRSLVKNMKHLCERLTIKVAGWIVSNEESRAFVRGVEKSRSMLLRPALPPPPPPISVRSSSHSSILLQGWWLLRKTVGKRAKVDILSPLLVELTPSEFVWGCSPRLDGFRPFPALAVRELHIEANGDCGIVMEQKGKCWYPLKLEWETRSVEEQQRWLQTLAWVRCDVFGREEGGETKPEEEEKEEDESVSEDSPEPPSSTLPPLLPGAAFEQTQRIAAESTRLTRVRSMSFFSRKKKGKTMIRIRSTEDVPMHAPAPLPRSPPDVVERKVVPPPPVTVTKAMWTSPYEPLIDQWTCGVVLKGPLAAHHPRWGVNVGCDSMGVCAGMLQVSAQRLCFVPMVGNTRWEVALCDVVGVERRIDEYVEEESDVVRSGSLDVQIVDEEEWVFVSFVKDNVAKAKDIVWSLRSQCMRL